jgi:VWFA-related protein
MRRMLLTALLAALATSAFAQEKLAETIEVRVLNVDVVVRDRAGRPVTGLTKDDFELWDNGRRQVVTNAYEVRPAAPALPARAIAAAPAATPAPSMPAAALAPAPTEERRERKIVVFIDNYSLPPLRRNQILKSLQKFIDEKMRPGDEAMIVVWQHSLKIVTQFTGDKQKIREAISSLAASANAANTNASDVEQLKRSAVDLIDAAKEGRLTWKDAYQRATLNVNAYVEQVTFDANQLLKALGNTSAALSGIEGRKALVFAGAHLPERPGIELYTYMYSLFQQYIRGLELTSDAVMGRDNHVRFSINDAAQRASNAGVTFYVIDGADLRDGISAENVGSYAIADSSESSQSYANTAAAYYTLARITGGVALTTENFDAAFDAVSSDFDSYYSIGYRPTEDTPGRQHKLVVKMKSSAFSARTRETYMPKSAEQQIKEKVIANIDSAVASGWPIEIAYGPPRKEGDTFKVPVLLSFAPSVTLLPKDGKLAGGFTIYLAVGNSGGGRSDLSKIPKTIEIAPEAEQQLRSKPMTFGALVIMTPGTNMVSVAIADQVTNVTGYARGTIDLK